MGLELTQLQAPTTSHPLEFDSRRCSIFESPKDSPDVWEKSGLVVVQVRDALFDDPVEGGASRNLAERVLLAAAEAEVDVNAMALVWRALGWVARAKSWLSFQTDGAT